MDQAERQRLLKLCADKSLECRKNHKFDTHHYGKRQNRYDFFHSVEKSDKLVIFLHGGRWVWGDLAVSAFLTGYFVKNNINCAPVEFGTCPSIPMKEIICQVRQAIISIMDSHPDQKNVYLMGHSSGAHLALSAMVCDWFDDGLTLSSLHKERLAGLILASGTYDIRHLCNAELNKMLALTPEDAWQNSPIRSIQNIRSYKNGLKVLIFVEDSDMDGYKRQAENLYEELKPFINKNFLHFTIIEGVNHISSILKIGDKDYGLTDSLLKFINEQS